MPNISEVIARGTTDNTSGRVNLKHTLDDPGFDWRKWDLPTGEPAPLNPNVMKLPRGDTIVYGKTCCRREGSNRVEHIWPEVWGQMSGSTKNKSNPQTKGCI